jgi:hypothetical protein
MPKTSITWNHPTTNYNFYIFLNKDQLLVKNISNPLSSTYYLKEQRLKNFASEKEKKQFYKTDLYRDKSLFSANKKEITLINSKILFFKYKINNLIYCIVRIDLLDLPTSQDLNSVKKSKIST